MNRQQRRAQERQRTALAREVMRAKKPPEYGQGYSDGGNAMCKAMTLSAAAAMKKADLGVDTIVEVLASMTDILEENVLKTNEELRRDYEKLGIVYDCNTPFSNERFTILEDEA